ncbi:MAG: hypothetical protein JXB34_03800 [Bacteroidales bacterium]|nr:hypothetical protein [Bacteroidales bacterium]
MNPAFLTAIACLLFVQCNRDEEGQVNFIKAGEVSGKKLFNFNESFSIEEPVEFEYSYSYFASVPLNIDENNDFDIRLIMGCNTYDGADIIRHFQIIDNGNNFEIAVDTNIIIVNETDTIIQTKLFGFSDIISHNENWSPGYSFISVYYNCPPVYYNINPLVTNKYIGVRKKTNAGYRYGWLNVKVIDLKQIIVEQSCFN